MVILAFLAGLLVIPVLIVAACLMEWLSEQIGVSYEKVSDVAVLVGSFVGAAVVMGILVAWGFI